MNTPQVASPKNGLASPVAEPVAGPERQSKALHYLEAWALAGLLVAIAVFFAVWGKTSGTFATSANLRVLVGDQAVIGVVALAALLPLTCNEWDLSIGANAGLC